MQMIHFEAEQYWMPALRSDCCVSWLDDARKNVPCRVSTGRRGNLLICKNVFILVQQETPKVPHVHVFRLDVSVF